MPSVNIGFFSARIVKVHQFPRRRLMKKIIVILAGSAVLSGCVSSQEQMDSHAPALNSWVGSPIEEYLEMHGTPTTTIDMIDYDIYVFIARKTFNDNKRPRQSCTTVRDWNPDRVGGGYTISTVCTTRTRSGGPPYPITYGCTYGLSVVDNVIKDWNMSGSYCKMVSVTYRPSQAETSGGDRPEGVSSRHSRYTKPVV